MELTQSKIDAFSQVLHKAAEQLGCIFVEESGEGHDLLTDTMYLEDVGGWLVPFGTPEKEIRKPENYRFAVWRIEDNAVLIDFQNS